MPNGIIVIDKPPDWTIPQQMAAPFAGGPF